MLNVVIPIAVLLLVTLVKKIPFIGGKIQYGLILCGALMLLLSGIYNPLDWLRAFYDGFDRFTWILILLPVASIYAQTQVHIGSMSAIIRILKALLGNSQRGLIAVTMIALLFAGSLLGSSGSAAAIVGVLVVGALAESGMQVEKIAACVVMGAALGSICPPVSTALYQAATIMDVDPNPVLRTGYVTILLAAAFAILYAILCFGTKTASLPAQPQEREKLGAILQEVWPSLIPVLLLIIIVVLNNGFGIDLITMAIGPVLAAVSKVPILKAFSRVLVDTIVLVTALSFFSKKVRAHSKEIFHEGIKNVKDILIVLLCAAFMMGCLYAGEQLTTISEFASSVSNTTLILGGAACLMLVGMLTGSDSVSLNTIFAFWGPALVAKGMEPIHVAAAGAHLAASGQGLPPADMTTFVVVGLLGGLLGKKIDPLKTMLYSAPMCVCLGVIGLILLYI